MTVAFTMEKSICLIPFDWLADMQWIATGDPSGSSVDLIGTREDIPIVSYLSIPKI